MPDPISTLTPFPHVGIQAGRSEAPAHAQPAAVLRPLFGSVPQAREPGKSHPGHAHSAPIKEFPSCHFGQIFFFILHHDLRKV